MQRAGFAITEVDWLIGRGQEDSAFGACSRETLWLGCGIDWVGYDAFSRPSATPTSVRSSAIPRRPRVSSPTRSSRRLPRDAGHHPRLAAARVPAAVGLERVLGRGNAPGSAEAVLRCKSARTPAGLPPTTTRGALTRRRSAGSCATSGPGAVIRRTRPAFRRRMVPSALPAPAGRGQRADSRTRAGRLFEVGPGAAPPWVCVRSFVCEALNPPAGPAPWRPRCCDCPTARCDTRLARTDWPSRLFCSPSECSGIEHDLPRSAPG
jgi:hypothetical protein